MKARSMRALIVLSGPLSMMLWGGCPSVPSTDELEHEIQQTLANSVQPSPPAASVINGTSAPKATSTNAEPTASALAAMTIDGVYPAKGVVAGGIEVTISGDNIAPDAVVRFGDTPASDINVLSAKHLVAKVPPHAAGMVDVTVQSGPSGANLRGAFEYIEPTPRIDSIEPASGPLGGGVSVTLRGAFFPANVGVVFGDTPAAHVEVISDELVTAIAPAASEPGVVDITLVWPRAAGAAAAGQYQLVVEGPFEYQLLVEPDTGRDTDGDGLTDVQERTGWEVWTEEFGLQLGVDTFGNVTRYEVASKPYLADTDGDGLDDYTEFVIKSDPRKADTDGDGLSDAEEWNQWLTSPTGVDNDADARGDRSLQNAPNQALFDGAELFDLAVLRLPPGHPLRVVKKRATSPTLADTDGDGVSDFDEFDSTVRNGVIADLPRLEYELVGDVDVRLNVEYAESVGQTNEYGTTLSESQSKTLASSFSNTVGWSLEVMNSVSLTLGIIPEIDTEITAGVHGEYTWTTSNETSESMTKEYSRLQSDSREFTESAADGAIRTAIRLRNPGNTTFTLDGLSVLVSQRQKLKDDNDTEIPTPVKTIATMVPSFGSIALAPGEVAGPFELSATGVNADAIKSLMSRPDSLLLGTASMNFRDQQGRDFDFVKQYTVAQTATIVIDFADGDIRTYTVATNVDRNPDSTYRGIKMQRVMEEVLGLKYGDPVNGYATRLNGRLNNQMLDAILGRRTEDHDPAGFDYWTVRSSNPAHADADFNDLVLRAGDTIHMYYQRDTDNDGVSDTVEKAVGTDQNPMSPEDADGDGMTDAAEIIFGWICFEDPLNPDAPHPDGFAKRRVFSDPREADADNDGLTDPEERDARSNPNDPDTDGDGLLDGEDPFPIRRAGIRFVDPDAPGPIHDGLTWRTAFSNLTIALVAAQVGAATPTVPDDDVAQIWVANGEYKPSSQTTAFLLQNKLSIYGGFSGSEDDFDGEEKRGERLADGRINGCIITGDLAGNDVGPAAAWDGLPLGPASRRDNARGLVRAPIGTDSSARFDGFMLTGTAATSAMQIEGSPNIQNCAFINNAAILGGAMSISSNSRPVISLCTFASNVASNGGAVSISGSAQPRFEDCSFEQNEAQRILEPDDTMDVNGGAVSLIGTNPRANFIDCSFVGNRAWNWGAGVFADSPAGGTAYVRVDSCRFFNNIITRGSAGGDYRGAGGGMFLRADAAVFNSIFWGNNAENHGGGIMAFRRLAVNNCTISANRALGTSDGGGLTAGDFFGFTASVSIENSILWGNWRDRTPLPDDPEYLERHQISRRDGAYLSIRNSCFNEPSEFVGNNNIGLDPKFLNMEIGDLRLDPASPCIDRGNAFVDVEPLAAGLQRLPLLDFFGAERVVDGNGDGFLAVDMGAYEAPKH